MEYDTIIVGGGAAGLNAALVLGRCCRRVLVVDAGKPRNYAAREMHNFLSRDGTDPKKLLRLGRGELARYGVEFRQGRASAAHCRPGGFVVTAMGRRLRSRTLLLATGVVDDLPEVPGFSRFYGKGVHHCPYCDAWEHRGRAMAAYGAPSRAVGLAMSLRTWTARVTALTDGVAAPVRERRRASAHGIELVEERVGALEGRTRLERVRLESGREVRVSAMFFNTDQSQRSRLPVALGCQMDEQGGVVRDRRQRTGVPGLYLAGDASRDVQFVIVAAAEGAKAGMAINAELQERDRREGRVGDAGGPRR